MRTCTVCKSPKRKKVEELLGTRQSYRNIGKQTGLGWQSIRRHHKECIPKLLEKAYEKEASTTRSDLEKNSKRMDKIIDAAEEWLKDPDNPEEYSFAPRAGNIEVMYLEQVGDKWIKRKEMLQSLLNRLEDTSLLRVVVKRKDPVDAFIQAAREFRGYAETIMRTTGELTDAVKIDLSFRLDPLEKPEGAGE